MKTLEWIRNHELPTGGIVSSPGHQAYPEVTGYLIPTLYDYGERDLARRCADWLLTVQNISGGYPAMNGVLHTFDTAAIVEGLERTHKETERTQYQFAADKARQWIDTMRLPDGTYREGPGRPTSQHLIRVNGIMGNDPGWFKINLDCRTHYIAYALEGYLKFDYANQVKETLQSMTIYKGGLVPFYWNTSVGYDINATAQIAILRIRVGLDASQLIDGVRQWVKHNGGIPQAPSDTTEISWGAKWYLDMERICQS